MSESGSDSEGSAAGVEGEGPIFPHDKLYYSSKDKSDIMAMPEIQREQILSERAQQVDRHNQDVALRRLLASREREEAKLAKKSKRKAGSAGLDDGNRKSSRQKTTLGGRKVGEASDAIEAYKRQREQKGKRDELRRRDPIEDRARRPKDESASEDDADGESEAEWDDRRRSPSPPKDDPPAELRDIQRARVGRSNFAQVCFYPGFDDAISGCYVRVNIGPNRDTGGNEYRLCLIKSMLFNDMSYCLGLRTDILQGSAKGNPMRWKDQADASSSRTSTQCSLMAKQNESFLLLPVRILQYLRFVFIRLSC